MIRESERKDMPRYLTGRRDNNEKDLCTLIVVLGGVYIPMHESAGFDLVVIFTNGTHVVEVKNPESKWKLTEAEKDTKEAVELAGGIYHIVQTDDDIIKLKNKE